MVKKLKQMAERQAAASSGLLDGALAGTVKASAQQIWLAGLGAFAKAQQEGGKVFDALVREGTALHQRTQTAAGEKLGEVTGRMTGMAGDVTAKAGQQWDRLEAIFEERTSRALAKLGVPSAKDVDALTRRIEALAAQVERLTAAVAAREGHPIEGLKVAAATTDSEAPAEALPAVVSPRPRARKPRAAMAPPVQPAAGNSTPARRRAAKAA